MLIRIKNAQLVAKDHVVFPFSKIKFTIATLLKNNGYVSEVNKRKRKAKKTEHDFIEIVLKYSNGLPRLQGFKLISKPSRRIYIKASRIKPVRSGFGMAIISTSKGIMSSKEAWKEKLGGEHICEVW
ncbi:MAG: 30S ribosomal protein S8 [Candidatus Yanofskybacteria bacterium RIFCSPHIGHO2_01_FULL_45_42]|uniref:Small ribosomal subunit protein uS8 n=3 Tax=Candidatus Yanofskyibacteriota TaxID=1752733 RepID=A0A1F8F5G0_9BACT|nr:MAG: 30S ribosomal protein S8 [Candidatus Yanofskybacteria bacterium RIFCSPHIGHO2_01_FULL_45_42]OGN16404.1 MAG: 30S ribosomal protein S8 [Candidatus Yanofskybacteria bacterium RIFCSPHIGHO2_02_FULL_46_19]OGN27016.1 MAG: 30S ribosomal protein S8 [Candidatus Yanofskybacteria bacterium RIFCSPLOWO2_01_FULL_45_72]OGN32429.1 MAG: 30S ribosomal protein S8 [Candidatus Yanofskybacteria bacterium RIFCSPLOWO2_02_FULL_45_18]